MRILLSVFFLSLFLVIPDIAGAVKVRNLDEEPRIVVFTNIKDQTEVTIQPGNYTYIRGPGIKLKLGDSPTIRSKPKEEYIIKNNKLHLQRSDERGHGD